MSSDAIWLMLGAGAVSGLGADFLYRSLTRSTAREFFLAAVSQKPGRQCNRSDDHQESGCICEGMNAFQPAFAST
jgi:hypothetical protein